ERAAVLDKRIEIGRDRADKGPRGIEYRAVAGEADDRRAAPAKRTPHRESFEPRIAIKLIAANDVRLPAEVADLFDADNALIVALLLLDPLHEIADCLAGVADH